MTRHPARSVAIGFDSPAHGRHVAMQRVGTGGCGPTLGLGGSHAAVAVRKMETTRERAISIFRAENGGFEPPRACTQHAFQACAIGH
jgi:hypothetical protein